MSALIAIVAAMTLPFCLRVGEQIVRNRCLSNVRQLGIAFRLYALDHGGRYPPAAAGSPIGPFPDGEGLAALVTYVNDRSVFYCPANRVFRLGPYAVGSSCLGRRMAGYACWAGHGGPGSQIAGNVASRASDRSSAVLASDIMATPAGRPSEAHIYTSHRDQAIQGGFVLYNDGHVSWRHYRQTRRRLSDTSHLDWYF